MLELPADSTSLLPNTIAVLDCGDHIIIRRNAVLSPSDDFAGGSSSSSSVISSKSNERGDKRDTALQDFSKVLMRRVEEHVRAVAAQRYPAPSVHVLHKPGTPQDRILYCRLTPTHMDAKENIFAATTAELQSCTRNFAHRPEEHAQHRSNALSLLQNLTMQTVEGVVAQAPYTDQLYFAKYLAQVAPVQAAKLLSKSALDPEEGMKAAPMSQYMDRGGGDKGSAPTPAVVLSPLIPPPTAGSANSSGSVHGSTFRNMHSSKSALPL